MSGEEAPNRTVEALRIHFSGINVPAMDFDECLVSRRSVIQPAPFGDRNHRIFRTVQEEDWSADTIDPAE